jgi:hypothetical protein
MPHMSAVPAVSPPERPPRVLLLDDDPIGRLLAGRVLRERGFEVVEFDRAHEALDCDAGATDVVIKSVSWTLLAHRIREALDLRRLERGDGREASASDGAGDAPPAGVEWWPSDRWLRGSADPFRLLDRADAPASTADRLEVELTESGMIADPEVFVAQLKAVRALGAGLAVDDSGTGHSSLACLTRLPLTTLKIDRSFVQDVHASERSSAVARAIVALGANLQLRVVAEGVETAARRDALISIGCTLRHGFLYGRAVPLDEALALADRRAIAPNRPSLESVS